MNGKYQFIILLLLVGIAAFPLLQTVSAQEDPLLEEILDGFEDNEKAEDPLREIMEGFEETTGGQKSSEGLNGDDVPGGSAGKAKARLPDWLAIDGYLKISSVYGYLSHDAPGSDTDWCGLTRLRSELKLELDADLPENWQARVSGNAFYDAAYLLNGRNDYTEDVLDQYEKEAEIAELYIQGSLTRHLDLKAGRQIVVWGRSDNIRITDVLNPLDMRWPGLVDIEKLRLPVTMTKLDYYAKEWSFGGILLHEVRYNKNPEFGSDFFPGPRPLPGDLSPDESFAVDRTQFAASVNGIFHGWDISFYAANVYAQNSYLAPASPLPTAPSEVKHARITMLGNAFNMARGNWLFKTEAAYLDGFKFSNTPGKEYSRLDALAGVEYTGFSDAAITLEMANRHYFNFEERLEQSPDFEKQDLFEWAFRLTQPCLNDSLTLIFLANIFGPTGNDGGVQRLMAEYDYTDAIQFAGGILFYQSGTLRRTMGIGDNDRLFFSVQYSF